MLFYVILTLFFGNDVRVAVFVAQLFGIADTAASVMTEECVGWKTIAILFLICGPLAFLVYSSYIMHKLIVATKTLNFNRFPRHSIKGMSGKLKEAPTLTAKTSQCFMFAFEIQF